MGSHTIVDGYTIMGGYRSVKDDQKCKVTSVAVFPSATAADEVLTTDAKILQLKCIVWRPDQLFSQHKLKFL